MSISVKNIKHKNKIILFPDFSLFEKSNDIYLNEQSFINYLENILFSVVKSNMSLSCFYNIENILEYFIQVDLIDNSIKLSKELYTYINSCSNNVRLIVVPIKLKLINMSLTYTPTDLPDIKNFEFNIEIDDTTDKNMYTAHSNLIIIDNFEKTIDFFEPHGEKFEHPISTILSINKLLEKIIKTTFLFTSNYKFTNSASVCIIGPQAIQSTIAPQSGHCLAWSLLFILLRILNANLVVENISQYIYQFLTTISPYALDSIIRRFITFVKLLPQVEKEYEKYYQTRIINYFDNQDAKSIEKRLIYLLNIFFQKQRFYSTKNIDVIYEEIISYRQLPSFHNIYMNTFKDYILQNSKNILEEQKLTSELGLD